MGRSHRVRLRLIGAVLLALALVTTLAVFGIRGLGRWLTVSDTLAGAPAIVVMRGGYPFRILEAGAIYTQGWAPEIWLTRTPADEASAALRRIGMTPGTEEELNRTVLGRLQVPAPAIRMLGGTARNTADEVKLIAAELRRVGGTAVIIVTSKSHTRRVRATWRAVVGQHPTAIVRYASEDPFHADRWWQYTPDSLSVTREMFGLLRLWTGVPAQAGERD